MAQASKCCCCVDLRTGGIIIGIFNLLYAVALIFQLEPGLIAFGIIVGLFSGVLFYGIFAKKADFIIPMIVLSIIELCGLALSALTLIIGILFFLSYFKDMIEKEWARKGKEAVTDIYLFIFVGLAVNIFLILLTAHFIAVLCSLSKQIREDARPNETNVTYSA